MTGPLIPPESLGYPEYRKIEYSGYEGGDCPVCGATGGNCKGSSNFDPGMVFLPPKKDDPRETFRVQERVYVEEKVGTRTIRKLLYSPGDKITPEEARRVGLR